MAATSPADSRLTDFVASLPDPGNCLEDRLVHTLACFDASPASRTLLTGGGSAFTLGHLRTLAADRTDRAALTALLTVLVAHRAKDGDHYAVTATSGVYGPGCTGLTWGDLLTLAL